MTEHVEIRHPATGRTAKVSPSYVRYAERRGWTSDAPSPGREESAPTTWPRPDTAFTPDGDVELDPEG